MLSSIQFPELKKNWNEFKKRWNIKLCELMAFYEKYKRLPSKKDDPQLNFWMSRQRMHIKDQTMCAEKLQQLNATGINFHQRTFRKKSWESFFNELKEFIQANNRHPYYKDPKQLFNWCVTQRQRYHGKLNGGVPLKEEQIQRLKSIGFVFGRVVQLS